MSSIKNIKSSNPMPTDLAQKLGRGGVAEILSVLWQGYYDLKNDGIIEPSSRENEITQEWYIRVSRRWYSENRAARITLNLTPIQQYEDDTLAKPKGSSPTIDFCFRAWHKSDGYYGAECKNLYDNDNAHIKRYVDTGVKNYINGRYGSCSSSSAMIGYVLTGKIPEIIEELKKEISSTTPKLNLSADLLSRDIQYKSRHIRLSDTLLITLHHLFFNFAA